jgi:hypothetical protein
LQLGFECFSFPVGWSWPHDSMTNLKG